MHNYYKTYIFHKIYLITFCDWVAKTWKQPKTTSKIWPKCCAINFISNIQLSFLINQWHKETGVGDERGGGRVPRRARLVKIHLLRAQEINSLLIRPFTVMNYVYMRVLKHLYISKYFYFINRKQANRFTWMERPKNFNLTSSGLPNRAWGFRTRTACLNEPYHRKRLLAFYPKDMIKIRMWENVLLK